jgi:hypothetical protein
MEECELELDELEPDELEVEELEGMERNSTLLAKSASLPTPPTTIGIAFD